MCVSSVGTLHGGAPRTGGLASHAIRTVQKLLPQGNAFRGTASVSLEWVLFWRKSANWRLLCSIAVTGTRMPASTMSQVARVGCAATAASGPSQLRGSHWSSNRKSADGLAFRMRLTVSHRVLV